MRLHVRLGLFVGGVLVFSMAAVAAILYFQVRSSFVQRSSEQAKMLASMAMDQGDRRARALIESIETISQDVQIGLLVRDAPKNASARRRLIEVLSVRAPQSGLQELTAIAPSGAVLARGHRMADFDDAADSAPDRVPYIASGSSMLRFRVPVLIRNRRVGDIEGGLDLSDMLSDMSRMFSGQVTLGTPPSETSAAPPPFDFAATKPWMLTGGPVLAGLVFSRADDEGRDVFRRLIARGGILFLLALAAGWFTIYRISTHVTRPIRILADAAADISKGRPPSALPPATRDEVGDLTNAFSYMAASLEEAQQKRLVAERLAAWQDAARMLAHEIKNPLSPIKTTITLLARAANEKDAGLAGLVDKGSSTVLTELSNLEKLLAEFSSFARFPVPSPAAGDFNRAVRAVVDGFRQKAGDVTWVEDYAESLPQAMIDAGMFAEVVRNIIQNALDVMAPKLSPPVRPVIHLQTRQDGDAVVLMIADSGPGISVDRRRTLFTPYFTTKAGGTGLGLAVSRKIMIEHGGDLRLLDASPFSDAAGAAFRAHVPLARV